ncbi:DNA internalization-related competence protein ComEC/Rec2 [Bacillota bacterium Lsc_1132]
MSGKYLYYAVAAVLGVLYSLTLFIPYFLLAVLYFSTILFFEKLSKKQWITLVIVFILFMFSTRIHVMKNQTKMPPSTTVFYLQFSDIPKIDGDQFQVSAKEKRFQENILVRYQIKSETEKRMLKKQTVFKRICRVSGKLEKPLTAKNENAFDYRQYLNRKQIYWVLKSSEAPLSTCIEEKTDLLEWLQERRFYGIRFLEEHFPARIASISSALIYGDRNSMEPELLEEYQKIGIIHLLAISGLHVSLFVAALYNLGIRAGATREWMTRFILIMLPGYAVLTGGSPSVIRSVVMIFLVMVSMQWENKVKLRPIDAISIAFALYLFISPIVLYDPGFQLSFSVSAAIILSAKLILKRYRTAFSRMISTSIIAQTAAFPILLFHFYELSFISIAANLLFIPLYSFVFLPGVYLLAGMAFALGSVPNWILSLFAALLDTSERLAKLIADIALFRYTPGRPNFGLLSLYILLVPAIFIFWEKKDSKRNRLVLSALCIFLITFQNVWNHINPAGEVTIIDVGQGDSILIHLPFSRGNYLIDTGGTMSFQEQEWQKRTKEFEVGKDVVIPYLKGKGITKIDKLILTHGDVDHIGGALAIIKELTVKEIVIPSVTELSNSEFEILQEARRRKIPVVKAAEGDQWKNQDSEFKIVSPQKNFTGDQNRGSLTVWAKIGGLHWFFGGDLDQAGEENIVQRFPSISIDVLKVGHHGSKTSSSPVFLEQYKPKISLISVGEKNRFGHPNSQVLERLESIHSGVYRTDRQGAISYRFYGMNGTFSTYLP